MRSFLHIRPFGDVEIHVAHFEEEGNSAEPLLVVDVGRYLEARGVPGISHVRRGDPQEGMLPFATFGFLPTCM